MSEYFNNVAGAMDDTEKCAVLKTIRTELIIEELRDRFTRLENRELSIKALFDDSK